MTGFWAETVFTFPLWLAIIKYRGTVEYSEEDTCLFGRISGINDIISYEGESVSELRTAFEEAVDDYLETCEKLGPPQQAIFGQGHAPHTSGSARQGRNAGPGQRQIIEPVRG